jgi:seryl-tRNA synthetase
MRNQLPTKYAGYSTCLRKEAGSHGKEGEPRVHQFEKVEKFVFCKPKDSPNYFDEMIRSQKLFTSRSDCHIGL